MKRLCTICVRRGSKGLPGKNWKSLAGKPLFIHSIEQALESKLFEKVALSTDSPECIEILEKSNLPVEIVERSKTLASDLASKLDVLRDCLEEMESRVATRFDVLVDLDATSPLRTIEDIKGAVSLLEKENCSNVITVCEAHRSPYFNQAEIDASGKVVVPKKLSNSVQRRQDSPSVFDLNASIYPWMRRAILKAESVFQDDTKLYVMPSERSKDIDSEVDFFIVEKLMEFNRE